MCYGHLIRECEVLSQHTSPKEAAPTQGHDVSAQKNGENRENIAKVTQRYSDETSA